MLASDGPVAKDSKLYNWVNILRKSWSQIFVNLISEIIEEIASLEKVTDDIRIGLDFQNERMQEMDDEIDIMMNEGDADINEIHDTCFQ